VKSGDMGGVQEMSVKIGVKGTVDGLTLTDHIGKHQFYRLEIVDDTKPPQFDVPEININAVQYSVFVREKTFNQFLRRSRCKVGQIQGQTVHITGIPVLDLPLSLLEGDVAIFAYRISGVENNSTLKKTGLDIRSDNDRKRDEAFTKLPVLQEKFTHLLNAHIKTKQQLHHEYLEHTIEHGTYVQFHQVPVDRIRIPEYFKPPLQIKVSEVQDRYEQTGQLPKIRVHIQDGELHLHDGYIAFLVAADTLQLKHITVELTTDFPEMPVELSQLH
jgi:hypothetical protein